MQVRKFKQFGLILICILSLFVSSVSSCTCLHNEETAETNVSPCHEHSETAGTTNRNDDNDSFSETWIVSEDDCICIQPQSEAVAKSENYKAAKQVATHAPVTIAFISQYFSEKVFFSKPLYLSDSFYNLSPGRAPPRL